MSRQINLSERYYQEACSLLPGGVNSPVRAFRAVGGTPITFQRGEGTWLFDVDGNRYLDFCGSWGPLILGHAHPHVVSAVEEVLRTGWSFGTPHRSETILAKAVLERLGFAEKIRFTNSGTEAVMTALRLARGVTGRPLVVKFEGCYHGHVDSLLVKAGSGLATFGTASSAGVPEAIASTTLILPLDDEEALEQAFAQHGERIAAVIIETIPANNGLLLQRQEFMRCLRQTTQTYGALLICDEVLVGFRIPPLFAYQSYEVVPDLVTLGKVIGGGFPVGAVAGRANLMEQLAPNGPVYQAGTLSGNPVAMTAGRATLEALLQQGAWQQLQDLSGFARELFAERLAALHQPVGIVWAGSIFWLYFDSPAPPRSAAKISSQGIARFAPFHRYLLEHGVYFPPSGYEVCFLNAAMEPADLERTAEVIAAAVRKVYG